ncbi:MAG: hypothetical protein K0R40_273 [Burkholderiales bacterium]|jgi:hypothetical protein|nr:hypothetical protein [Burkholderiales bacterium]
MTKSQIRIFVQESSVERIREVLNRLLALQLRRPLEVPPEEMAFLLDLRDHEAFFRTLADEKLQGP